MFKVRVKCISKNTGEVFYEYETKIINDSVVLRQKLDVALSVFQNCMMSDVIEDCTFEATVLKVREGLLFDFDKTSDVEDYNKTPVVF